jgi:hypothetical protein
MPLSCLHELSQTATSVHLQLQLIELAEEYLPRPTHPRGIFENSDSILLISGAESHELQALANKGMDP